MKLVGVLGCLLVHLTLATGVHVSAWASCCPSCGTKSIPKLNADQLKQVEDSRAFIEEIESNPDLLNNREYHQREVVTLTDKQKREMLRNFPEIFVTEETYNRSADGLGTITAPGRNLTRARRAADDNQRVCAPEHGIEPFVLVRNTGGQVVRLASSGNRNQWIFEETCLSTSPSPGPGQECGLAERHIPALFINLSEIKANGGSSEDLDFARVIIQSCVTLLI